MTEPYTWSALRMRRADRVRALELTAIAVLGLSLGLGLVRFVRRQAPATETQVSAATGAAGPTQTSEDPDASGHVASTSNSSTRANPKQPRLERQGPSASRSPSSRAGSPHTARLTSAPTLARGRAPIAVETARSVAKPDDVAARPDDGHVAHLGAAEEDNRTPNRPGDAASQPAPAPEIAVDSARRPVDKPRARRTWPAREFEQGLVVYWPCQGRKRTRRRFPCPRDRRLEEQVWGTLAQLSECRVADPGRGGAQLRITAEHRGALAIEVQSPAHGRSLNLKAVRQCVAPRLTKLGSRLRGPHSVVTFAFRLH